MKVIDAREYKGRWSIVFTDDECWRAGIYVPENASLEEVVVLEKHDRPELFILLDGEITLVLSEDGVEVKEVRMEQGKVYVVEEWHNAYRPGNRPGRALVIEAANIQTEYLSIEPLSPCRETGDGF